MTLSIFESEEKEEQLAAKYGIPFEKNLSNFSYIQKKEQVIPYAFAKKHLVLPLEKRENVLKVALSDPLNLEVLEELRCLAASEVEEIIAPRKAVEAAIEQCYRQKEEEASKYIQNLHDENTELAVANNDQEYDLLDQRSDSQVIRLLNVILVEALQQGASDVHFEPLESGLQVRYRIDGVLALRHSPPRELQDQLITRIKVIAQLDIAEHRLPQDGRIKLKMAGREVDFRASTVPSVHGERLVLRILDRTHITLGLDNLNMPQDLLVKFRKKLRQNQGIVLVTGPTGSGKTTTLYSAISEVKSSQVNIMTIEDPVEYKLAEIAQIGVNPKIDLTFAKGLRHILRQDPDVILIGEIRDKETAEIAIQASLTGHLVLSTLHTNDAPSALTRLVDMGIEPYLLSSSVLGVLAQRLVRQVCPDCAKKYTPSREELEELEVGEMRNKAKLYMGEGCASCFQSGYKGRRGIYEFMPMSAAIKRQLLKSADSSEIYPLAKAQGMKGLRTHGAELAFSGVTTSSEVLRVTRSLDDEIL